MYNHNLFLSAVRPNTIIPLSGGLLDPHHWRREIFDRIAKFSPALPPSLHHPGHQALYIATVEKMLRWYGDANIGFLSCTLSDRKDVRAMLIYAYTLGELSAAASPLCNCSQIVFSLAIGDLIGLNPDYLFIQYKPTGRDFLPLEKAHPYSWPQLDSFCISGSLYQETGRDFLLDFDSTCRLSAHRYTSNSNSFIAFANRRVTDNVEHFEKGFVPAPAFLINRTQVLNNPGKTVIWPLNPLDAFAFRHHTYQFSRDIQDSVIIAAFYGGMEIIEDLNWADLVGREIIVCVSPDREEWKKLSEFGKLSYKKGVQSVRVCPTKFVGPGIHEGKREIRSAGKEWLKQNSMVLDPCDSLYSLVSHIENKAFQFNLLNNWEIEHGFAENKAAQSRKIFQFRELSLDNNCQEQSYPLDIDAFFSWQSTMIYGPTDTGKSTFALGLAIAIATGTPFLGLKPCSPQKIVYLDGELGTDLDLIVRQLSGNLDETTKYLLKRNLKYMPYEDCRGFLAEKTVLIEKIMEERIRYLVIDNILALTPEVAKWNSETFSTFNQELITTGITPIFVHHTAKDGKKYIGSEMIEALTKCVLKIEPISSENEKLSEAVRELEIRVTLEKTKRAPRWRGKSIELSRPIGGTWSIRRDWPKPENIAITKDTPSVSSERQDKINSLSPNERKVYEVMLRENGRMKREEIEDQAHLSKSSVLAVLKSLEEKGLVEREGQGKAISYRPLT